MTSSHRKHDGSPVAGGGMSFCIFAREPSLRYDLRRGGVEECWDRFIPSLADKVRGGEEYLQNCGSCENKKDCRWCPVYGWLEHGRFDARVGYLCEVASQARAFKRDWAESHCRFFEIGGITIRVESDLPITDDTFRPKFECFRKTGPGKDNVVIRHHFQLPDIQGKDLGREIYSPDDEIFRKGGLHSLTLFATDQILLSPLLADRKGLILHSAGAILDGMGLLFAGHSEAGKSTISTLLKPHGEILCDDRMIVRETDGAFRIFGTWSHGDVPDVSPASAPLRAIMFLEKADENALIPIRDRGEIVKRILAVAIKAHETPDWWRKTLDVIEKGTREVPCYRVRFDRTGEIVPALRTTLKPQSQ